MTIQVEGTDDYAHAPSPSRSLGSSWDRKSSHFLDRVRAHGFAFENASARMGDVVCPNLVMVGPYEHLCGLTWPLPFYVHMTPISLVADLLLSQARQSAVEALSTFQTRMPPR